MNMEKNQAIAQINNIFQYVKLTINNKHFDGEEFVNNIEKAMELYDNYPFEEVGEKLNMIFFRLGTRGLKGGKC